MSAKTPHHHLARLLGFPLEDVPRLAEWGTAQVAAFVYRKGHRNMLTKQQTAVRVARWFV